MRGQPRGRRALRAICVIRRLRWTRRCRNRPRRCGWSRPESAWTGCVGRSCSGGSWDSPSCTASFTTQSARTTTSTNSAAFTWRSTARPPPPPTAGTTRWTRPAQPRPQTPPTRRSRSTTASTRPARAPVTPSASLRAPGSSTVSASSTTRHTPMRSASACAKPQEAPRHAPTLRGSPPRRAEGKGPGTTPAEDPGFNDGLLPPGNALFRN